MTQSPPTAYQQVHALLVDLFQEKDHLARMSWLLHADLSILLPYLTPNQPTLTFVTDLLRAAYTHGEDSDRYLRLLLDEVRKDVAGHPDHMALLTALLQREDLEQAVLPNGVTWAEGANLHRTRVLFQRMPTEHVPNPAPLPTPNTMTIRRNTDFVGRQAELQQIARALKEHAGVAVAAGIGGVGKTQTAIEWVHRYGQYFLGGVFWLDFSSPEAALVSIASSGAAYGWAGYEGLDVQAKVARVKQQWQEATPTLLIFDNCESIELARLYTPVNSGVRVLLTSRNTTWRDQARSAGIMQVDIVTLPRSESIALLQRLHADISVADANAIADLLGDLPLALHIAGSYLSLYRTTSFGNPTKYIEALQVNLLGELEESGAYVEGVDSPTDHNRSIQVTFRISWERLYTHDSGIATVAETLLLFLAQFAPGAAVPEEWLWKGLPAGNDARDGVKALAALRHSGLVEAPQVGAVQLHRLIAEMVSVQTAAHKVVETGLQVEKVLLDHVPIFGTESYIPQINRWLPHAQNRRKSAVERCDEQGANLLNMIGVQLVHLALFVDAQSYLSQELEISSRLLGMSHPDTATSLNNLALLYERQGKYAKALPFYRQALDIFREVLGYHPKTAATLNNLANLYLRQGEYTQALTLNLEALEIQQLMRGKRHPNTAMSLNNLANVYERQGEYAQALPLYQQALEIYKEVLGIYHSDTATSLNNVALLYQSQGEYGKALSFYQQALEIRQSVLGARHPDTAASLNNLALLHERQGKYAQALPLYQQALEIYKEVLGTYHPDTAMSLNNLALLYQSQGEYEKALPLYQQALEIRQSVLGTRHPDTASSLNNLALLYERQGAYTQALPLYEQALAIYKEVLGVWHPCTAANLNNLAGLYEIQGKYDQALIFLQEGLKIYKEVLGALHPDTAMSLHNLALLYEHQGEYTQALPLYQEALDTCIATLGAGHPDTKIVQRNLAHCQAAIAASKYINTK